MKFENINLFGLVGSGTKIGKDVFFWINISQEKEDIDNAIFDIRTPIQFTDIGVVFYSIEYKAQYYCFTIYESIYDGRGRLGYCAISVLMPVYEGKALRTTDESGANNVHIILQNLLKIYKDKYLNTNYRIKENTEDVSLFTAELDKYKPTSVLINTSRKIDSTQKCGILFENDTDLANIFDAYNSKDLLNYGQVFILNNKDKDKLSYGFGLVEIPKKDTVETVAKNTGEVKTVEEIAESLEKVEKPPIKKHSLYEEKCDVIIEIKQALDNNKEGVLKDATLLVDNKPYEPEPKNKYNGKYEIKDLLVGSIIEIKVSKEGYQDKSQTETISKENNLISIVLEKKAAYGINNYNAANTNKQVSITILVKEGDKPLKGANISIGGKNDTTNKKGECTISDLPVGEITIEVSKKGYETIQEPKHISNDGQQVYISLEKESNNDEAATDFPFFKKYKKLIAGSGLVLFIILVVGVLYISDSFKHFGLISGETTDTLEELNKKIANDTDINYFLKKEYRNDTYQASYNSAKETITKYRKKVFHLPTENLIPNDSNKFAADLNKKIDTLHNIRAGLPNKIKLLTEGTTFDAKKAQDLLTEAKIFKIPEKNLTELDLFVKVCQAVSDAKAVLLDKPIEEINPLQKLINVKNYPFLKIEQKNEIKLYCDVIERKMSLKDNNLNNVIKSLKKDKTIERRQEITLFLARQGLPSGQ